MLSFDSEKNLSSRDVKKFDEILRKLKSYGQKASLSDIKSLFAADMERFKNFSTSMQNILIDYSKMPIDKQALNLLLNLAEAAGVNDMRQKLFSGARINLTEQRSVLHTALRLPKDASLEINGENIVLEIHNVLKQMENFTESILNQRYLGYTGKPITDIVNIGIGGSDLGPRMVYKALKPYRNSLNCHFVANIDAADIADCLFELQPETTLFIITSKTFTTSETLANAIWAKDWLTKTLPGGAVAQHFVAITANLAAAEAFGISAKNCFRFWDWVGGRYSMWSAVGLPIMLSVGSKNFYQLLKGAFDMDTHFRTAEPLKNLPLLLGLLDYYKRVCCNFQTTAIVVYEQRLEFLPPYLQQLCMESNGKSATRTGKQIEGPSGAIIWGATGTNGQHAFFQLLHQGTDIVPVEFIFFAKGHEDDALSQRQHNMLLANCLAQSEALLEGKASSINAVDYTKHFSGNRPSISIAIEQLIPYSLGQVLAMYEHRVFVEGILLDINSFDQWGVELGKELAKNLFTHIEAKLAGEPLVQANEIINNSSTRGLLAFLQKVNLSD